MGPVQARCPEIFAAKVQMRRLMAQGSISKLRLSKFIESWDSALSCLLILVLTIKGVVVKIWLRDRIKFALNAHPIVMWTHRGQDVTRTFASLMRF